MQQFNCKIKASQQWEYVTQFKVLFHYRQNNNDERELISSYVLYDHKHMMSKGCGHRRCLQHRVPTKISEKSSMIFPWLLQAKIQISRQKESHYLFLRPLYQIVDRQTQDAHSHTDTHIMICSWPTDYSTDFTSNWTDSRSQNYTC